jgi:hypothetical protein
MKHIEKRPPIDLPRQGFDDLCAWIDDHLEETIGWQQLFECSGMDHHALQTMFFKHADTTPMTWIRGRRQKKSGVGESGRPMLTLKKKKPASLSDDGAGIAQAGAIVPVEQRSSRG